jgi:tripartite-type tricarboxylate transporter receptor subunit TctC
MKYALALVLTLLLGGASEVSAQQWPDRPVRVVVPYQAGGNVDIAGRVVAQKLSTLIGQSFYIENRPGAGGLIATDFVANAAPDGYTLLVAPGAAMLFTPPMVGRADYDWRKSLVAVGSISLTPAILEVIPSINARTLPELIALAKTRSLNLALGGPGSISHFISELMQEQTGAKWQTVMYKGNAPTITALMSGECDFSIDQISTSLELIRNKQLIPIAVTSRKRQAQLPDVPTFAEQGYGDMAGATFTGLFAPTKTPQAIVDKLADALAQAVQARDVVERFESLGSEPFVSTAAEFKTYVEAENDKWLSLIKRANIKAD